MSEGDGNSLHLDLTKQCGSTDKCECPSPKPHDIQANKEDGEPVKGFFKRIHVRTSKGTFTLPQELGDKSQFKDGLISGVTKVEAYYGNQRPKKPLLLAITTSSSITPEYYINNDGYEGGDVGRGNWNKVNISQEHEDFQKTLDHFNCKHNQTIPINLKNPTNLSQFYSENRTCLKSIVISGPKTSPYESEYEVKTYQINPPSTHLSRVTYGDTNTDMGVPTNSVTAIKVYTWTKEEGKKENERTPLLVEFKTTNEKFHYRKNLGTIGNTSWESTGNDKPQIQNTELTNLLKEARCNVFYTFQAELDKEEKYGNNSCSKKHIHVDPYADNSIENYKAHKHTYNGDDGGEFIITEFMNKGSEQNFGSIFPIRKVKNVIVYFCSLNPTNPLLVYYRTVTGDKNTVVHNWYKNSSGSSWTSVGDLTGISPDQHTDILKQLDKVRSPCQVPSVTIDIKNGPGKLDDPTTYNSQDSSGAGKKNIKVTKESVDGTGYEIFKHIVDENSRRYFTVQSVKYGTEGSNISAIAHPTPIYKVTAFYVYYWKHGYSVNGKPLLIKVVKDGGEKWYENTGDPGDKNWKSVTEPDPTQLSTKEDNLKKKLDLLNCRLNNVVVVDASMKPDPPGDKPKEYCHDSSDYDIQTLDKEHPSKLQVKEDPSSTGKKLATYKAYEHSTGNGKFHIVGFKNRSTGGGTTITLQGGTGSGTESQPLLNVSKVIFYFCNSENSPLLVYYEQKTSGKEKGTTIHHWYKHSTGNTWQNVPELPITTSPTDHTDILEQLDKVRSPCQPPSVTIDIKNGPNEESTYNSQDTSGARKSLIEVGSNEDPTTTNYKSFTHKVQGNTRKYFTVENVMYNNQRIDKIVTPIEKVKAFIVYYWAPLKSSGNPLLIKIEKHGGDVKWYENQSIDKNNDNWNDISQYKDQLNEPSKLKKKLKFVNCYVNNVTAIDIGKKPSDEYCHDNKDLTIGEKEHSQLIQVTDVTQILYSDGKLGKFAVYQHSLNQEAVSTKSPPPVNFHISGFTNKGTVITLKEKPSPIPALHVPKVLVYFCDKDKTKGKPLLVHFTHSTTPSGEPSKQEWYQRNGDDWTKVEKGVPKNEEDTPSIYSILNNYATSCKDDTLLRILLGTAAGSAGGGATTYGVYEMIRWLFMSPWPRLM